MILFAIFLALPNDSQIYLQSAAKYEINNKVELVQPGDLTVDTQGRLHVLDVSAGIVYVWDERGRFLKSFGRKGKGPGEFEFKASYGGNQGFITAVADRLYVFDGAARLISIFDQDHNFIKRVPFNTEIGQVLGFWVLSDDKVIMSNRSFFSETPHRKVVIYDLDKEDVAELARVKDTSWRYIKDGSKGIMSPYLGSLDLAYNQAAHELIISDTQSSEFRLFSTDGELTGTVKVKLKRRPLKEMDKKEFTEHPHFKNQNFFTAEFPEYMPYFDRVLPVGPDHFLIFLESELYRHYAGHLIDRQGAKLGSFRFKCGEGGRLFSSRGRLFGVIADDKGEFHIHELKTGQNPDDLIGADR